MGGSRGGGVGAGVSEPLENQTLLYVSLEILARTPSRREFVPEKSFQDPHPLTKFSASVHAVPSVLLI